LPTLLHQSLWPVLVSSPTQTPLLPQFARERPSKGIDRWQLRESVNSQLSVFRQLRSETGKWVSFVWNGLSTQRRELADWQLRQSVNFQLSVFRVSCKLL
ncbi:hypothetical protein LINPERHAP1_LOCUS29362, partial [Linum perenne]